MRIKISFRSERQKKIRLWIWVPNALLLNPLFARLIIRKVNRHVSQNVSRILTVRSLRAVSRELKKMPRHFPGVPLVHVLDREDEGVTIYPL